MVDLTSTIVPLATESSTVALSEIIGAILSDPLSVVSILFGGLFIGGAMLAFGILALGAVADFVTPDLS
ncbi:hypothetical protein [Halorientalis salina]|uniref:hypothetical protein n=1 Tax=Halorientalis salina TaxID=2932266 RepID=UPI002022A035|nr:hypothetical protein [Halorientalis salina]